MIEKKVNFLRRVVFKLKTETLNVQTNVYNVLCGTLFIGYENSLFSRMIIDLSLSCLTYVSRWVKYGIFLQLYTDKAEPKDLKVCKNGKLLATRSLTLQPPRFIYSFTRLLIVHLHRSYRITGVNGRFSIRNLAANLLDTHVPLASVELNFRVKVKVSTMTRWKFDRKL